MYQKLIIIKEMSFRKLLSGQTIILIPTLIMFLFVLIIQKYISGTILGIDFISGLSGIIYNTNIIYK